MSAAAGECAHCGLPLPRRPARVVLDGRSASCCCYGCVLALTVTRGQGESGAAAALLVRLGLAVFFTMNVMMVTMPTYASAVYGGDAPADGPLFALLRGLGVLLATPVLLLLGGPVLASAAGSIRGGLGVDALVVLGTAAAYGLSLWSVLHGGRELYVDTACMLLVLVTLGRYLEAQAKAAAGATVRAVLGPAAVVARRLGPAGDERIDAARLAAGERVLVRPGERFPTDGVIEDGAGGVDESMLTGEAGPRLREPGAEVFGGTVSVDGRFVVRVTRPLAESASARLTAMLGAALAARTRAERLADRAAAVLGPVTVAVALGAGAWWAAAAGPGRGVMVALSALVVACPCALGIAIPAAVWTAVGAAAKRGVVLRSAPVLERLARVRCILFDKTGTLTTGQPQVSRVEAVAGGGLLPKEILRLAAGLEADTPHPVARALMAHALATGMELPAADALRVIPGHGVTGRVHGQAVTVASARFLGGEGFPVDDPEDRWTWVVVDGRVVGRVALDETIDPEAPAVVHALRALGLRIELLSGAAQARAVVPSLLAPGDAHCGLTPEGKVAVVRQRGAEAPVAMVGDGLNDAPALAAADVGIAVGRATDLARVAADVVVLGGGLGAVPWLVRLARRSVRIARQNLAWAFLYNAVALALAAGGRLTPVVAAFVMLGSSATVLANARRLVPRRTAGSAAARGKPLTPSSLAPVRS
jgi:Cu2+-exporting ATPase